MAPAGDSAAGAPGSGDTTGTVVDTAASSTTGAVTSGTGGGTTTSGGGTAAASTTTGGTTTSSAASTSAGTTGGTGSGTAGSTGTTGGTVTGGGNACTPDGWDNYAQAKFSTWCGTCHGISFSTLAQVKNDVTDVQQRITSRNMPKGQALDADTYTRLVKWMTCGLPQ